MKKYLILLLSFMFLVGCGENKETQEPTVIDDEQVNSDDTEGVEDDDNLDVDKGLFDVTVTIPASFYEDELDMEQLEKESEEIGITDISINDDGSVTYKMPKSAHKKWLQESADELDQSLVEMVESDDFVSIKDISPNKNYSEFTMVVDGEAFENSFDSMAILGIHLAGAFYQFIDGTDPEDYSVKINVVDEESGDIIDSLIYPDDLNEE